MLWTRHCTNMIRGTNRPDQNHIHGISNTTGNVYTAARCRGPVPTCRLVARISPRICPKLPANRRNTCPQRPYFGRAPLVSLRESGLPVNHEPRFLSENIEPDQPSPSAAIRVVSVLAHQPHIVAQYHTRPLQHAWRKPRTHACGGGGIHLA